MGTAAAQSALWGARAQDWADFQESTVVSLYQAVLQKTQVGKGTTVLDVGCGAGLFCQMASQLGAKVSGLHATDPFLAIARTRLPQGDFHNGDMETLPFADHQFDYELHNKFRYLVSIA